MKLTDKMWKEMSKPTNSGFPGHYADRKGIEQVLASIPEHETLTDEQLTAIDAMHDRGDFGFHVYTKLRNLFTQLHAPAHAPAPEPTKHGMRNG
jgi:hypothetical protein